MNRRSFFAALLALPFAPAALDTLAKLAPAAPLPRVSIPFSNVRLAYMDSILFDVPVASAGIFSEARIMEEAAQSIRHDLEHAIMNGLSYHCPRGVTVQVVTEPAEHNPEKALVTAFVDPDDWDEEDDLV